MPHVLIVDDDPVVQRLLSMTFRDEGYDVAVAADGEEAVRAAVASSPDAIILDLEMPHLDGRAVFRELRRLGIDAPVIILSANGAHVARRELRADGAVEKPFDASDLLSRVERLMGTWPGDSAVASRR